MHLMPKAIKKVVFCDTFFIAHRRERKSLSCWFRRLEMWRSSLGGDGDRQWVKNFGASDKRYELAAWLDGLGLKLIVEKVQKVDR